MSKILVKQLALMFFVLCFRPVYAHASVLSWTTTGTNSTWTAGAPAAGGTVSQIFTTTDSNVKAIVTITESNPGGVWYDGSSVVTGSAPQISTALNGGAGTTGIQTLMVGMLSQSSTSAYIQVTVSFVLASNTNIKVFANGVSTTLFDVDKSTATNTYTDQISNILGSGTSGVVGISSITTSSENGITSGGTSTSTVVQGTVAIGGGGANNDNNTQANVTFGYGSQAISGFSFQYSDVAATTRQIQFISLGDINFTEIPTPEMNPGLAAVLACVGGIAFRRHRFRRS